MSTTNSVKSLKLQNVLDPRLECMSYAQNKLSWTVFKGTESSNWVHQQCNAYSSAGINFNFNSQGENVIIDRRLYAQVQFKLTFTGTAPIGQPLINSNFDAPRAYPLASVTNSLKVTINGGSVEVPYNDALQALLRYNNEYEDTNYDLSTTPNFLDNYQDYADGVNAGMNPLANYQNSQYKIGRGAFTIDNILNPVSVDGVTPIVAVITFTVVEPLLISPLLYKSQDLGAGLIGVKNLAVLFSFNAGQLNRVWSHATGNGVVLTNVLAEMGAGATSPPILLVNYLNPPLLDIGSIPNEAVYEYYKTETYTNDLNIALGSGVSQTFTNNAIQLSTVPKAIYIYATLPQSQRTYETTDTFFRINSISLQYLNVAGQFSSMNEYDLYQMCLKNGLKMNWNEFHGETFNLSTGASVPLAGAVLKINVEDLSIPSNLASGVNENSQLIFNLNIENVSNAPKSVSITTVIVYDGMCTVSGGQMITQLGVISQSDVMDVRTNGEWVPYKSAMQMYGGSFWDKLKSFGKSVLSGVKSVVPFVAPIVKGLVPESRPILSALGMGRRAGAYAGAMAGGELHMTGGKRLSRSQMRQMMDE